MEWRCFCRVRDKTYSRGTKDKEWEGCTCSFSTTRIANTNHLWIKDQCGFVPCTLFVFLIPEKRFQILACCQQTCSNVFATLPLTSPRSLTCSVSIPTPPPTSPSQPHPLPTPPRFCPVALWHADHQLSVFYEPLRPPSGNGVDRSPSLKECEEGRGHRQKETPLSPMYFISGLWHHQEVFWIQVNRPYPSPPHCSIS